MYSIGLEKHYGWDKSLKGTYLSLLPSDLLKIELSNYLPKLMIFRKCRDSITGYPLYTTMCPGCSNFILIASISDNRISITGCSECRIYFLIKRENIENDENLICRVHFLEKIHISDEKLPTPTYLDNFMFEYLRYSLDQISHLNIDYYFISKLFDISLNSNYLCSVPRLIKLNDKNYFRNECYKSIKNNFMNRCNIVVNLDQTPNLLISSISSILLLFYLGSLIIIESYRSQLRHKIDFTMFYYGLILGCIMFLICNYYQIKGIWYRLMFYRRLTIIKNKYYI